MTSKAAPKLRPPNSTVLVTKAKASDTTTGGILLSGKGTINGIGYDIDEEARGGQAFPCCIVAIGAAGMNKKGIRESRPKIRVGDEVLVQPHGGECVLPGEPETWVVDWCDILAVLEPATP